MLLLVVGDNIDLVSNVSKAMDVYVQSRLPVPADMKLVTDGG